MVRYFGFKRALGGHACVMGCSQRRANVLWGVWCNIGMTSTLIWAGVQCVGTACKQDKQDASISWVGSWLLASTQKSVHVNFIVAKHSETRGIDLLLRPQQCCVSRCLAPEAARRSNSMLSSCFDRECDPFAYILVKRFSMLRRMLVRYFWLDEQVFAILSSYRNRGFPGTASAAGNPMSPMAPWFGDTARAEWKTQHFAMGPVGYLLYSASHYGLCLDQAYNVYQGNEVPYNLLTSPFQYLKPLVRAGVFRKRSEILSRTRTGLAGVGEVDFNTLRCTLQREKGKKLVCSLWHATLAGWSNSLLQAIDYAPSAACRCGHPLHTFRHAVWECPLTQPLRDKYTLLSRVDRSRFSASLAAGIPSMISADINTCPWDPSTPWTSNDFESFARDAGNQHHELMKYYHEATVAFDNIMGDEALKGFVTNELDSV